MHGPHRTERPPVFLPRPTTTTKKEALMFMYSSTFVLCLYMSVSTVLPDRPSSTTHGVLDMSSAPCSMDRRGAALFTAGGALVGASVACWQRPCPRPRNEDNDNVVQHTRSVGSRVHSMTVRTKLHNMRETDGQCK